MKTHHSTVSFRIALMIGALALTFASCKKSPETIGNNLISDNDFIGIYHTDTVAINCHSYLDSIGTKNVAYALLGSMSDPVFGLSQAGFCTQFHLSAEGQSFGEQPVMDSLVLQLCLSGYYGDTTTLQTVHAYMLTDSLSSYEDYNNLSEVPFEPIDQANSFQFRPHPRTKIHVVDNDTLTQPIIRIPLSADLGNYLMNLDAEAYTKPDLFKELFKGLRLCCEPPAGNGSVSYISLTNNSVTQLQLYYHDATTPENRMRYNFYVTTSDTYFNQITHDYSQGSPEFVSQVLEGDTTLGQQMIYTQTMGGVRTKITFPDFTHWTDTLEGAHIVINDAKIIIPAAVVDTAIFTAPTTMVLVGFNADGTSSLLPDYLEGTNYFGGIYSSKTQSVTFRISEYLQDLMTKEENYGLSFGINGAGYSAQRLILNGPEAQQGQKMQLQVTYSIVNE